MTPTSASESLSLTERDRKEIHLVPDKTRANRKRTATAVSATKAVRKPRILIFDIECSGLRSDFGLLFCVSYKGYGEAKTHCIKIYDYPNWQRDMTDCRRMLKDF